MMVLKGRLQPIRLLLPLVLWQIYRIYRETITIRDSPASASKFINHFRSWSSATATATAHDGDGDGDGDDDDPKNNINIATDMTIMSKNRSRNRIETLIQELESVTERYFVYDSPKLTLPLVRQNALSYDDSKLKWSKHIRFSEYSRGEIRFLQALENHPLRTFNDSEASFFIIPIPIGATFYWAKPGVLSQSINHLLNEKLYQQHPQKHVLISVTEDRLFNTRFMLKKTPQHVTKQQFQKLQPTTIVRDIDLTKWYEYTSSEEGRNAGWALQPSSGKCTMGYDSVKNINLREFENSFSVGWSHAAAEITSGAYEQVSVDTWSNKTHNFFYHTRVQRSRCNSTQYRHALVKDVSIASQLLQPSSIGYDIPKNEWIHKFRNSKFCLAIRGDSPGSRSEYRSIRAGCMPLIVSDAHDHYLPLYNSVLKLDDYALIVSDEDFLKNPTLSLNSAAISLMNDQYKLEQKINGLKLAQRIIVLDHPKSLFVQAFIKETIATQQQQHRHESTIAASSSASYLRRDNDDSMLEPTFALPRSYPDLAIVTKTSSSSVQTLPAVSSTNLSCWEGLDLNSNAVCGNFKCFFKACPTTATNSSKNENAKTGYLLTRDGYQRNNKTDGKTEMYMLYEDHFPAMQLAWNFSQRLKQTYGARTLALEPPKKVSPPTVDVLSSLNKRANRLSGVDARKKGEYYGNNTVMEMVLTIQKVREAPSPALFFATRSNSEHTFVQLPSFVSTISDKAKFLQQLDTEKDTLLAMLRHEKLLLHDLQILIDTEGHMYHIDLDRISEASPSASTKKRFDKNYNRCEQLLAIVKKYVLGNATTQDLAHLSRSWGYKHTFIFNQE